jgi:hypothetical protein
MDLYCKRCGEPYDMDHVGFEMLPLDRVRFWDGEGCPSCYSKAVAARPLRAEAMGVMHDLLGDDTDGIAAMMEDFDFLEG